MPSVLWWGNFDPGYSRNRILRKQFADLGWQVREFQPRFALVGDWEASLRRLPRLDLVWVPCFRQRDLLAASRWAKRHGIPLIFDPLISAYDKQVDERGKLDAGSTRALRLLARERVLFRHADRVIADTPAHADYFVRVLGVDSTKIEVIYVGAEEALFRPGPLPPETTEVSREVLFYGSFIPLQGPQVVVEAARLYQGPPLKWVLLGEGPLRRVCEELAQGHGTISFEDWLPYQKLPERIQRADILLGVFGATPKAGRVIPNKVFQSLASGRVVVTRMAESYPEALLAAENQGLEWVPAGDPRALAEKVAALASDPIRLRQLGEAAAATSRQYFSEAAVRRQLAKALAGLATDGLVGYC
ncbi:MAG: glycosyltransferase [Anderseniella sp.]|nr:glycosyltransferase [Anderseniella sp.]